MLIKKSKKQLLAQFLAGSGCGWLLRRLGSWSSWSGLLTLNYHRIGSPEQSPWDHDLWSGTAEAFDWQVRYLKTHFDLVHPGQIPEIERDRRGRYVLLSFDDGYRDNYQLAFDVLRRHRVPATFFLATGFLDQPRISWWDEISWMVKSCRVTEVNLNSWFTQPVHIDREHPELAIRKFLKVYKSLPLDRARKFMDDLRTELGCGETPHALAREMWMTWDMVREMHATGMHIGSHTVTHPILSRIPLDQQRWEIVESRRRIEQEVGHLPVSFSYPVGGQETCTDETIQCLKESGVQWAFRFGVPFRAQATRDRYQIPRLAVERYTDRPEFQALTTLPKVFGAK